MKTKENGQPFLLCERNWVYYTLITVAGMLGAYTYLLRGNVFCNAQTGNVVLMGLAIGAGQWTKALYYLIPIFAYLSGAFVSEFLPDVVKQRLHMRWETLLIAIEMVTVVLLGCIPESAPVQISQVIINFIASMQYNTFRQAEGTPMATTFATNHIRQIGIGLAKEIRHRHLSQKPHRRRLFQHLHMLLFFLGGASLGTVFCNLWLCKAIWATLLPFGVVFAAFLHADLNTEKNRINQIPSGH